MKNLVHTLFASVIFSLFLGVLPASPEEGNASAEYQAGFYYTVKKGDTLWDLSNRFADSPWEWPELWHHNTQLTNPHWIYPGQLIRIYQKSWIGRLIQPEPDAPVVTPPPPDPVIIPTFIYPSIDSIGYIKENPVIPSGIIFKVKDDKEMISQGDMVYLSREDGRSFSPDEQYTVYRTFDDLRDPEGGEITGIQHYLTGVVRITRVEARYAIGAVSRSYRTIEIGDKVLPYRPKSMEIELTDGVAGLEGTVIASEEHASIMGDHTIAFIDKGTRDGVRRGQMYQVYYQDRQPKAPNKKSDELLAPVTFGELLVLHTEAAASTAIITRSDKSISPGAQVHAVAAGSRF